ncbi:MAG: MFS transporter [Chroococcidiopsidaceae cyanobacterium CP_BM_ER_R8_30]|nr:MFS transporter [Chroococcidiopsidaceae cyanobacterium CP_BM_ER_R8_30]
MNTSSDAYPEVTPASEKLNLTTKLAYGAGDMGTAISINIVGFFLSFFLTNVAGLSAELASNVRLISGIWDAVLDPMVGVLSDKTRSRWGRRHPWMLLGAIPLGVFFLLQWIVPPLGAGGSKSQQWELFWYYVAISACFNTSFTAVNLPYTALTPELTQDYNERTSLNSFRFAFSISGSILSLVLANVIFSVFNHDRGKQFLVLGCICAVLVILPAYVCVWGTRARVAAVAERRVEPENTTSVSFWEQLRIVFSNRPFLFVTGIYLCSWLGVQITQTVIIYYVVSWMKLPEAVSAQVALAVQGTALVMLFVWSYISKRVGKKAVYFMGMSLWIIAQAGLFFLQPGQVGLMYAIAILAGFGVSTAYLIPWSMMPDVIELDELRTGQRREGIFYGFITLLQKAGISIGLFLVLQALGWAGYIKSSGNVLPSQPPSALLAIRLAIGPLPTLCLIVGLVLAYFYPITREVHAEILLKLKERREGEQVVDQDV